MSKEDIITINDGQQDLSMRIRATFSLDDQDYACLESVDSEELFLLKMYESGDEMVFETIDDDEEFDEVIVAYEELLAEEEGD